jgi:hypothetical protein
MRPEQVIETVLIQWIFEVGKIFHPLLIGGENKLTCWLKNPGLIFATNDIYLVLKCW